MNDNFANCASCLLLVMFIDNFKFDIIVNHFSPDRGALFFLWAEVATLEYQSTGLGASVAR